MTIVLRWVRRARLLLRRSAVERAMEDELSYHVECETRERIRSGMTAEAARNEALRQFGGLERLKEEAREVRGTAAIEDLITDIRYAARILRRNPGFTAAVLLTLTLGIGAAGAIFSVVYGVLLRPLPYLEPDRLVVLWEHNLPHKVDRNVVSVANFEAWQSRTDVFSGISALVPRTATLASDAGVPERIPGAEVSVGYFHLLGIAPVLGRDFLADDTSPNGGTVVILSSGLWKRRFGGDPAILGKTVVISEKPYNVVGVMPAGFEPPQFGWLGSQELWFPFVSTPQNRSWGRFLLVVARMRPDVSLAGVRAEMSALGERLAHETTDDQGWTVSVVSLADQITGSARVGLLVVLCAVCLLFLIALTNVATLSLSLSSRRAQELAIRRSLGATDHRLLRQLLTQNALLGLLGTAMGVLVVRPAVRLLTLLAPPDLPRLESIAVDVPVFLIMVAVAILAIATFGFIAALRGRKNAALFSVVQHGSHSRVYSGMSGSKLVILEIAVALTLSVSASLMARSFAKLRTVDLGFNPEGAIGIRLTLGSRGNDSPASENARFETILERVRALPGVQSASLINIRPLGGLGPATEVADALRSSIARRPGIVADVRCIDSEFFATLRIPILKGSRFSANGPVTGEPRVVISESLARMLWPGESPIGRRLYVELYNGITAEVIGVAGDTHIMDPRTDVRPLVYLSSSRFPTDTADVIVRTSGDPATLISSLRKALAEIEPTTPLYRIAALSTSVSSSIAADRFTTFLLALFAALALFLGSVGIFGIISGQVTSRRKEIGIRMALGAKVLTVTMMMLRQILTRAAVGVAIGTVLALSLARSMRSLLFGVESTDPLSFLMVTAVIFILAIIATLVPTVQAMRSSPFGVLHEQ